MSNALTIKRSEYVRGRPRQRFDGSDGIGILSISLIKLTSSGSRGTIQLPPAFSFGNWNVTEAAALWLVLGAASFFTRQDL